MLKRENVQILHKPVPFHDRLDAGRQLADQLQEFLSNAPEFAENSVVLGVPKGGMLVAAPVSRELGLPLDLVVTRKLRSPAQPDVVTGAVTERGRVFLNKPVIDALAMREEDVQAEIERETLAIQKSVAAYRTVVPPIDLANKTAILVDDNVITGATMFATLRALWAERPRHIVLAVPVAPRHTLHALCEFADHVIALHAPVDTFTCMDDYYRHDDLDSEAEICEYLRNFLSEPVGQ